jgi:hypothetical protein
MRRVWAFLLAGILLGTAVGLYLGWVVYPTELTNATPAELTPALQADYLRLVAATYAQDGNSTAVQSRLAALRRPDLNEWVLSETVNAILQGTNETDIRHLVALAMLLGLDSPAFVPYQTSPLPVTAPEPTIQSESESESAPDE